MVMTRIKKNVAWEVREAILEQENLRLMVVVEELKRELGEERKGRIEDLKEQVRVLQQGQVREGRVPLASQETATNKMDTSSKNREMARATGRKIVEKLTEEFRERTYGVHGVGVGVGVGDGSKGNMESKGKIEGNDEKLAP
jgi:hypothetical protein